MSSVDLTDTLFSVYQIGKLKYQAVHGKVTNLESHDNIPILDMKKKTYGSAVKHPSSLHIFVSTNTTNSTDSHKNVYVKVRNHPISAFFKCLNLNMMILL